MIQGGPECSDWSDGARSRQEATATHQHGWHRKLKKSETGVYGTKNCALFDSGTLPNIMSEDLCRRMHLLAKSNSLQITAADGKASQILGEVTVVATIFAHMTVQLSYLLLDGAPYEAIVGVPAMEALDGEIDLRRHTVPLTLADGSIRAILPLFNEGADELGDDGTKFTTEQNEIDEDKESESESGVGIVV